MNKRLVVSTLVGFAVLSNIAWLGAGERVAAQPKKPACVDPAATLLSSGVGLGTRYGDLVKKLGPPLNEASARSDPSEFKTVRYFGALFRVTREDRLVDYYVHTFSLTGSQYSLASGLKVGDSNDDVARLVGEPKFVGLNGNTGNELLHFDVGRDGYLVLEMQNERVVQISVEMY